jgi:hypothetical protein
MYMCMRMCMCMCMHMSTCHMRHAHAQVHVHVVHAHDICMCIYSSHIAFVYYAYKLLCPAPPASKCYLTSRPLGPLVIASCLCSGKQRTREQTSLGQFATLLTAPGKAARPSSAESAAPH